MVITSALPHVRNRAAALVGALVVVLGVFVAAGTASAHAELLSSSPGNQQLLEVAPTEIALQFTEAVDPIEPGIRLVDSDGNDVEIGGVSQAAGSDRMRSAMAVSS